MDEELAKLFAYIKKKRMLDFSAYRQNTVGRRLQTRLIATGAPDYGSYLAYLRENPEELNALVDALLIKVSCFFRNPLVFDNLLAIVLPELLDACEGDLLKIWCAGCARGEEAYSIAMLIKDLVGKEQAGPPLFILGTDVDGRTLEDARKAEYQPEFLGDVRKSYLDRYFTAGNGLYRVSDEIKNMVVFAHHDITTCSAPKEGIFSDYHLILCRNVNIYLDRALSEKVLTGLSRFIPAGGYMVLGEAESLPVRIAEEYSELSRMTKIFRKKGPWQRQAKSEA